MTARLTVIKRGEFGYKQAMIGLGFNKKKSAAAMHDVAIKLAPKDGGHNKFLEAIYLWLEVRAPRYWWQEADTFRLASKQSESTMHTLVAELRTLDASAIEEIDSPVHKYISDNFEHGSITNSQFHSLLKAIETDDLVAVKNKLPEGFLQRRLWVINYKCLRNIILQRRTHRLPHWHMFIKAVLLQVEHPELLPKGKVTS